MCGANTSNCAVGVGWLDTLCTNNADNVVLLDTNALNSAINID